MKITTKTTKEQLVKAIGANISQIDKKGHKDLYDRLAYTDKVYRKDSSNVTKADLVTLVKDMMKALGDKFKEPALQLAPANSLKKPKKAEEPMEETPQTEETAETPKKKATKKKATPKKSKAVETAEDLSLAKKYFPETYEIEENNIVTTMEIAHDIKTVKDLTKALEENESSPIVFAFLWTKAHLKKYKYFDGLVEIPKEFPDNLDLATCIYSSENNTVAYALSQYTEAFYTIVNEMLEEVEGVRYCNGCEFQVYRVTEVTEVANK